MKNRSTVSFCAMPVFISIFLMLFCPAISPGQEAALKKLKISIMQLQAKESASTELSREDAKLTTKKIVVGKNETVQNILTKQGISADGESLGILYKLNSGLTPESIRDGAEITVPVINLRTHQEQSTGEQEKVALTLDREVKLGFLRTLIQYENTDAEISRPNIHSSLSAEATNNYLASSQSILENMKTFEVLIRGRTRPLNSEMIQQMNDEADQMTSILANMAHQNGTLTEKEAESVALIRKNMDLRMMTLDEVRGEGGISSDWPEVEIVVRAIDSKNGREVPRLRVYYVCQGLWNDQKKYVKSFDQLTSPSQKNLPEADYYIWAGNPQDPTPLSDRKTLEARKRAGNEMINIDLTIP